MSGINMPDLPEYSKKIMQLVLEPSFQQSCQEIIKNPNLKWLYVGYGVVFISYIFLKRKVLSATDRWTMRLLLRLVLFVVFMFGLAMVSYGVLGKSIVNVVWEIAKVVR